MARRGLYTPQTDMESTMKTRNVVGCMSGTSMDAIDAALVRIEGNGLSMRAIPLQFASSPLRELAAPLRALAEQIPMSAGSIAALSREFSLAHVAAIRAAAGQHPINVVAVHGQTVFHAPPVSWQLLTPAVIVQAIAAPLVCDMRAADLAAGGQGAPMTPLADWILFRSSVETRAILNLGGFANFTLLPRDDGAASNSRIREIQGGDICACNQLLDGLARRLLKRPFDEHGTAAAAGSPHANAVAEILACLQPFAAGRSLGTSAEPRIWTGQLFDRWIADVSPADLLASAVEAVASRIAGALPTCDRILLAGGGAKNRVLHRRIAEKCSVAVECTDAHGIPVEQREAIEMAVLGALCQDRVPITLPSITRVTDPPPTAGLWTIPR